MTEEETVKEIMGKIERAQALIDEVSNQYPLLRFVLDGTQLGVIIDIAKLREKLGK